METRCLEIDRQHLSHHVANFTAFFALIRYAKSSANGAQSTVASNQVSALHRPMHVGLGVMEFNNNVIDTWRQIGHSPAETHVDAGKPIDVLLEHSLDIHL